MKLAAGPGPQREGRDDAARAAAGAGVRARGVWERGVRCERGRRAVCDAWAERGVRRRAGGGRPAAWAVRRWAKRELARAALAGRAGVASWAQERSGGLRVWVVGLVFLF